MNERGEHEAEPSATDRQPAPGFRHEALVYRGNDEFLAACGAFIEAGAAAGDAMLVAVSADKIALLRDRVGEVPELRFADMVALGANPARIIPAWTDFVAENLAGGRALRGIGEPVWAERRAVEMPECHRHESLLNVAFADAPHFWLLCPYDAATLPVDVIDEVSRTHPYVAAGGTSAASATYAGIEVAAAPFDDPLPPAPAGAEQLAFGSGPMRELREFVSRRAAAGGLDGERAADLVAAVTEVATNSVLHGGGGGDLRAWADAGSVVVEVRDAGFLRSPLAGRVRPGPDGESGRGLWLVNQLCDLVQVRTSPTGTAVRLHMWRG